MSKKCEKKDYTDPKNPKYRCDKCKRMAKKKEKLCKPKKIEKK